MAYWDRRRVQAPERKLRTPLTHVSPQLIASAEALAILRVSRNSLSRFVRQGLLQRFRLRVRVAEGPRLRFYYLREIKKSEKKTCISPKFCQTACVIVWLVCASTRLAYLAYCN